MALMQDCLWWRNTEPVEGASLEADAFFDVGIIGAGFTGLWTAYFLHQLRPHWRIAIFEQHHVGYGASGRNGGWLLGGIAGQDVWLSGLSPAEQTQSRALLYGIIDSVKAITKREQIHCTLEHKGVIYCAARYSEQKRIALTWLQNFKQAGHGEDDFHWLSAADAQRYLSLPKQMGAIYSPHCATINPAQLATGLARVLLQKGVKIFHGARVTAMANRQITINHRWQVNSGTTVLATEAFASPHKALNKKRLPVFSAIVATDSLPASVFEDTVKVPGLAFSDVCRSVTYGQRTANNELIFGARGGYLFGGRSQFEFSAQADIFNTPKIYWQRLLPSLSLDTLTYQWAGSLAMSRRFSPFVNYDAEYGLAAAGGDGGEGVGASHLYGQTLAELIAEEDSVRVRQPWVCRQSLAELRNWEPEPLPWLAYKVIGNVFRWEDYLCHANKARWLQTVTSGLSQQLERLL